MEEGDDSSFFMIEKAVFIQQLERAEQGASLLPVTHGMLSCLLSELKKGDPPWWKRSAKSWEKREFVHWAEAWGIFISAVHYEALSDAQNPLVPYFPSCGGTAEADPSTGLLQFLKDPPQSFFENLKKAERRVYLPARNLLWPPLAQLFFQTVGFPYYVVEVNAGAGLNMAMDLLREVKGFNSDLIEARIGLDSQPMDIHDINHRRWLTASFLPEQMAAIDEFDEDVEKFVDLLSDDSELVQVFPSRAQSAPEFLVKNILAEGDVGLLIFNAATTGRMSDAEYAQYQKQMFEAMRPWNDRVLWVEIESVRGEMFSTTFELKAWKIDQGKPAGRVLARFDFAARKTDYSRDAALEFLLPPGVAVPPEVKTKK